MPRLNHTQALTTHSQALFFCFFFFLSFFSIIARTHLQGASMVAPSIITNGPSFTPVNTIKFLCSYGGKILPRHPDGKLRYFGGETRVLAVDRSISFSELLLKMGELACSSVSLRCQLPKEDLDALVSITCDEDLLHLIEEYDRIASPPSSLKIRAFLSPPKLAKKISPPPSSASSSPTSDSSPIPRVTTPVVERCFHYTSSPLGYPLYVDKPPLKHVLFCVHYPRNPSHIYLIHGNHWQ